MDDSNVEMLCCVKICFGADFSQEVAIDWPIDCHCGVIYESRQQSRDPNRASICSALLRAGGSRGDGSD